MKIDILTSWWHHRLKKTLRAGLPVYEWVIRVLYFSQLEPLDLQHSLQAGESGAHLGGLRKQKKPNNMPLSPSPGVGVWLRIESHGGDPVICWPSWRLPLDLIPWSRSKHATVGSTCQGDQSITSCRTYFTLITCLNCHLIPGTTLSVWIMWLHVLRHKQWNPLPQTLTFLSGYELLLLSHVAINLRVCSIKGTRVISFPYEIQLLRENIVLSLQPS